MNMHDAQGLAAPAAETAEILSRLGVPEGRWRGGRVGRALAHHR